MSVATFEPPTRSCKQRLQRAYRRTVKAPVKGLLRLQGYDNSQAILLESFNAIYFQIPKVASSSLKSLLKKELELPGMAPHCTRFPVIDPDKLETGFYSDYFKFCFVRNPWKRIVSCYHSKITNKRNINHTLGTQCLFYVMPKSASSGRNQLTSLPVLNVHMSFKEFVNAVANIQDENANKHFRSQHTFLCNARGELLVDYVGHLETFNDDFKYVAQRTGLSIEGLKHSPRLKRGYYKDYYDEEMWETISQRYRKDIELLGYEDCRFESGAS